MCPLPFCFTTFLVVGGCNSCVHVEMLVFNNDLLLEIIDFCLLQSGHLLDHVFTGDEDSLKVAWVRECLLVLDLRVKVFFAVIRSVVDVALLLALGLSSLSNEGYQELVHLRLIRPLRVLIPVSFLPVHVEPGLRLPPGLILLFVLQGDHILVHEGERLRQVVL